MEIWRDIEGYEGLYRVSNMGSILCLPRWVSYVAKSGETRRYLRPGKIKTPWIEKYPRISLCKNGKEKNFWVHRLVARAFIANPEAKPEINHKDGDKLNNNAINLEWVTCKENSIHSWDSGLINNQGEGHGNSRLRGVDVMNIRRTNASQREIAKAFGVCQQTISKIKRGESWKHLK